MFAPFCPQHRSRVLLSVNDITELRRDDAGFNIHFTCQCGYTGWHRQPNITEGSAS